MIDVHGLIESVLRMQGPEADIKQIQLRADLPPEPVMIYGDEQRILQVLTNLVVNAVNYTTAGGEVILRVRAASERDPFVALQVQDTGVGISPEHLPHIFEPFYRGENRGEGTGLGLSITRQIVELHGGTINVESVVGQGSTFEVRLPTQAPESEQPVTPTGPVDVLQPC